MCSCDFEVNRTKIRGGCQSERKVVNHNFKSDLPLIQTRYMGNVSFFRFILANYLDAADTFTIKKTEKMNFYVFSSGQRNP